MKKGITIFSLLFHLLCRAQGIDSLYISEIMFYPSETNGEFIELYNASSYPINLFKYKIIYSTSSADTIVAFTDNTILNPNNFAVIFENDYDFVDGKYFGLISDSTLVLQIDNSKFGSSGMANTSNRFVYLLSEGNDTIDYYEYTANNKSGFSDEKIDITLENESSNWANSVAINGTPGISNSVSQKNYDVCIQNLFSEPEIVFVDELIYFTAKIENLGKNNVDYFDINIFIDLNNDSLNQLNEQILDTTITNLSAADSLELTKKIIINKSGIYNVYAEVIFNLDENKDNNYFSEQLIVREKPNAFNDLVINEIMYKPLNDQPEWIEIFNNTNTAINLKNWRIADKLSVVQITNSNVVIQSNEFFILSEDSNISNYFDIDSNLIVLNLPSLNNTGDNLKLLDSLNRIIDSVDYKETWGGNNGYSLERISSNTESNISSNWNSSQSKYFATPGKINSISQKENDITLFAITSSAPYAIVGDNYELNFLVRNIGLNPQANFTIEIYNDLNQNLMAEEDEIVKSFLGQPMEVGDSLMYTESIDNFKEGKNQYIIILDADLDDDIENNMITISFNAVKINVFKNDLIINEIMYSPSSPEPEWFEIYNRSDKFINLNNYHVADGFDTTNLVLENIIISPNEYFTFCDDSTFNTIYPQITKYRISNLPTLNNGGDKLILLDSLNRTIDSVEYFSTWGGVAGKSLERISSESLSTDSTNWQPCKYEISGTPSSINSVSKKDFDIRVSEIIFTPENPTLKGTVNIAAKINNIGKESVNFFVQLFEDVNIDSSNINLIESTGSFVLTPNDSATIDFSFVIDAIIKKHKFIVKAIVSSDQDTTNNQLEKTVSPGFNPSSIIINEIMYSPTNGEPEWIELLNTTTDSINISDFIISDILTTPKSSTIVTEQFILPNGFLLISKDSLISDYHSYISCPLIISNFANLNNDIDGVVIKDSF